MKKQTFIKGSMILMALGFISRAFGVFFKVPLDYLVGEEGQGLYYILYPVYAALISMASVGLTVALSRQIATYCARDKRDYAWAVFEIAFKIFLIFGIIFTVILWLGSPYIIRVLKWPIQTYWGLMGLVLAPLFISMVSAFRGLFQGHENMIPTGVSMIIEQFARVIVGIGLTWYIMNMYSDVGKAVGGATFGATAGGLFALVYLVYIFVKYKDSIVEKTSHIDKSDRKYILKELVFIAIPVAFGSAVISIMSLVDSLMLPAMLNDLTHSSQKTLELIGGYSRANTIMNIPLIIAISISTSIVPFVAKAWEKKEYDIVKRRIDMGMKIGTLLALPATFGIAILSKNLVALIFSSVVGYRVLVPLSFALILMIYAQIQTNVLVAVGSSVIPVVNMFIGVGVKVIFNILLLKSSDTKLVDVGIAVVIAYVIIVLLNGVAISTRTGYKADILKQFAKPIIACILMVISIVIIVFIGERYIVNHDKILTLFAVIVGGITYLVSIIKIKYLNSRDMEQIPGINVISKFL